MSSNEHCLLGQWYKGDCSDYFSSDWTTKHGFSLCQFDIKDKDCQIEWILLKNEWIQKIKEKRRELKVKHQEIVKRRITKWLKIRQWKWK